MSFGDFASNTPSYQQNIGNVDNLLSEVNNNIQQFAQNVAAIEKVTKQLGTKKDTVQLRERLLATINQSKQIAQDTTQKLKLLGSNASSLSNNQQQLNSKLTKNFNTYLQKFQNVAQVAMQKEQQTTPTNQRQNTQQQQQQQQQQGNEFFGVDNGPSEKESLLQREREQQIQQFENASNFNDSLIEDREKGIKEIETAIVEVNEIFTDLGTLVAEQGVFVDNIESNIVETSVKIDEGNEQLKKAGKSQRSARNKKCCVILILVIAAAVIVAVSYILGTGV